MTCYIDTSALVPLLVLEPQTEAVMAWFARQAPGAVLISDWTHTEIASALALKLRTGHLTLDLRADALAAWKQLHTSSLPTLAIIPEHFDAAASFASQHLLGLRAPDALHVAIAASAGARLLTLDQTMANAALQLGVPIEPL